LLPHRLVEVSVDGYLGFNAGDANVQLVIATDVDKRSCQQKKLHGGMMGRVEIDSNKFLAVTAGLRSFSWVTSTKLKRGAESLAAV
jgi:hypothetical protein